MPGRSVDGTDGTEGEVLEDERTGPGTGSGGGSAIATVTRATCTRKRGDETNYSDFGTRGVNV